ncbi:hypothetical protein ACFQ1A_14760, partial [Massilia pinisoli]
MIGTNNPSFVVAGAAVIIGLGLAACGGSGSTSGTSPASTVPSPAGLQGVKHTLLISIDGLHQQDLAACIAAGTCPNIASLANTGVTY